MKSCRRQHDTARRTDGLAPTPHRPRGSLVRGTLAALFVRRERWTLTWPGRLIVLAVITIIVVLGARNLCVFLAVTSPVGGEFLVVEGWMPAYAYRQAVTEFRKGGYRKIIAAGTMQDDGDDGEESREHSGAEKLIAFGVPRDLVVIASYGEVHRDRTFHAAMAVKQWLQAQGLRTTSVDVVTVGPHARRSRLLYEKAVGNEVAVGVFAIEDRKFDPGHWWRSSEGVRTVVDESIAYLYARLFFFGP
jgi:uncharacterized SAM-binding protein YcdF (DUF218 family)